MLLFNFVSEFDGVAVTIDVDLFLERSRMAAYVTIEQAKALTGVTVEQELLDEAQQIIHGYTPYRWTPTTITDLTLSGYGMHDTNRLFRNTPITAVGSLVVDGTTLVVDTDYKTRSEDGIIEVLGGIGRDNDNVVLTYTYGFTDSHRSYAETIPIVRGAEARIALYLKRNPAMLSQLGVGGVVTGFSGVIEDHIRRFLYRIPKQMVFAVE